ALIILLGLLPDYLESLVRQHSAGDPVAHPARGTKGNTWVKQRAACLFILYLAINLT
ncbi:hypothetical protein Dimus_009917, partial [Dionaea muscipula]